MKIVELPILEYKKRNRVQYFLIIYIFLFLSLICNILIFNLNILNYIFITGIFIFGIIMRLIKNDRITGIIYLSDCYIKIKNEKEISINEIQNIKFTINGYEGRKGLDNIKSIFSDDGKNNSIEFSYNNKIYNYRFYLTLFNHKNILQLLKKWENNKLEYQISK